jgi:hypothetical protein
MVRRTLITALAGLATLAPAAPAAERWASPESTATNGTCAFATPCRIDHAVNAAIAGDVVKIKAGAYTITTGLVVNVGIAVQGVSGPAQPRLVADPGLATPVLDVRAPTTVENLFVESRSTTQPALYGDGAVFDKLNVRSPGTGVHLVGDPGTTVLRDSAVVSTGTGATHAAVSMTDGVGLSADAVVINATVYATGGSANGIVCGLKTGQGLLYNTLARGAVLDVAAGPTGGSCGGARVNVRSATYTGLTATPLQHADPKFFNLGQSDFRPVAGSPTIDAGRSVQGLGTTDLLGAKRIFGAYPDIGAHEFDPTAPTPEAAAPKKDPGTTEPVTPKPEAPKVDEPADPRADVTPPGQSVELPTLGKTIVLDLKNGSVLVKLPGQPAFKTLSDLANLPVGAVIDTRKGSVTLSTALPGGSSQTGTFSGGLFEVRQPSNGRGMTDIYLRGGSFAGCGPVNRKRGVVAVAAAKGKKRSAKRTVRRLWASDRGGRFRTHGRESVATVRGTRWVTEDRCDGTLTRVTQGAVDVRNRRTGKVKRVRAGRSIFVPRRTKR